MDRLTRTDINGIAVPKELIAYCGNGIICDEICTVDETGTCLSCPIQKCFDRLKEYEDTGLSPEDVRKLKTEWLWKSFH